MNFVGIIIAISMVLVFLGLFALGMYLNKKTPVPDEFELPSLKCQHCTSASCSYSEVNRNEYQEEGEE